MSTVVWIVLGVYMLLLSIVSAVIVIYDKSISKLPRGSIRRISEKTFVILSAFGGGIGTLLTMFLIRHKTKDHVGLLAKIMIWTTLWCLLVLWLSK